MDLVVFEMENLRKSFPHFQLTSWIFMLVLNPWRKTFHAKQRFSNKEFDRLGIV